MTMNTPRMTEAWARSSRTADGFYSTAIPMSVFARNCYEEGCKLERELANMTAQRDRLAEAALYLADVAERNTDDTDLWQFSIANVRLHSNP